MKKHLLTLIVPAVWSLVLVFVNSDVQSQTTKKERSLVKDSHAAIKGFLKTDFA